MKKICSSVWKKFVLSTTRQKWKSYQKALSSMHYISETKICKNVPERCFTSESQKCDRWPMDNSHLFRYQPTKKRKRNKVRKQSRFGLVQFCIQLVYKQHFGTWILLFGPFGQKNWVFLNNFWGCFFQLFVVNLK